MSNINVNATLIFTNVVSPLIGGPHIYETIPLTELNRPGKVLTDDQLLDHGCVFSYTSNHSVNTH